MNCTSLGCLTPDSSLLKIRSKKLILLSIHTFDRSAYFLKLMIMKYCTFILLFLSLPFIGISQDNTTAELPFEVNKVLPYIFISKDNLKKAEKLIDLDKNYKEEWVDAYVSVEILAQQNGKIKSAISKNDLLSQEQKDLMLNVDSGTDIQVKVLYMPENNLSQNEVQLNDFTFTVNPDNAAEYPEGEQKMLQYLKENAIDKIPEGSFTGYDFAAVKFTVNEEGEVTNVHLFDMSPYSTAEKKAIDALLLETIRKMPCWKPAEYADGLKVAQEYVFSVGNHANCVVPLLSIREYFEF